MGIYSSIYGRLFGMGTYKHDREFTWMFIRVGAFIWTWAFTRSNTVHPISSKAGLMDWIPA